MPRYFFDSQIGEREFFDYEGSMHPDLEHARPEALLMLAHLSQGYFPSKGGRETIAVSIRDEQGRRLATAKCVTTVTFTE